MGKVNLSFDFVAFDAAGTGTPRGSMRFTAGPKMRPYLLRFVLFKRAGMRLLLGHSHFREHIENRFAFDFQLPCQVVNSNLTHPPFISSELLR